MRAIICIIGIIFLTACALGAQTKEELYKDYGYKEKRCSQLKHKEVYNLLYENMNKCIAGVNPSMSFVGNIVVDTSSSVTIQAEYNEKEGSTIAAYVAGGPGHYFYSTIVKIKEEESCPSGITIYGMSSMNKKDLNLIDNWLTNNTNDCTE